MRNEVGNMTVWGVLAGLATGFSLGFLGSGGSIIALPALVYLLGVASKYALAMSLGVVSVTAALAAAGRRVTRPARAAVGVGLLTGLVGAGGGFLVVPALVLFSGLTMKRAIGTSLAVVAANAGAGFYGYLGKVPIDWTLMEVFVSTTLLGSVFGTRLSSRLSHNSLKRGFAWFLIFVASYILLKNS